MAPADAILRVNLLGVAHFLDEFAEVIADGGAGVVIASMAGTFTGAQLPPEVSKMLSDTPTEELMGLPIWQSAQFADSGAAYGIAKRGNRLRVQAASVNWGKRGARVNSISPGITSTFMGKKEMESEAGAQMRHMVEVSATKRLGTSTDIANAVEFLMGPDSSFVSGTDLLVDGGVVAGLSYSHLSPEDM